jgi:predicted ABC-type ATPase
MHYCQDCDDPHLMLPADGVARCPVCGGIEPTAATRPLFVVTGASGAGKTTIFPELLRRLAGRCVVFDVDWLIDPLRRAAKDGDIDWAAFRDAWLYVAHGVAQNGLPTLLLGPFIPEHLEGLPGRAWVGEIHYLVLDCPDDLRRQRIEARPPLAEQGHPRADRIRPLAAQEPRPGHRHQHLLTGRGSHGSSRLGARGHSRSPQPQRIASEAHRTVVDGRAHITPIGIAE